MKGSIKIKGNKPKKIVIASAKKRMQQAQRRAFFVKYRWYLMATLAGLLLLIIALISWPKGEREGKNEPVPPSPPSVGSLALDFAYPDLLPEGIDLEAYIEEIQVLEKDIKVESYLWNLGLNREQSKAIAKQTNSLGFNKLKRGQRFYWYKPPLEMTEELNSFFIYQLGLQSFALMRLDPVPSVELKEIEIETKIKSFAKIVNDTFFWRSYQRNQGDFKIALDLAEAFKWQIDFYHVRPNDRYKLIYEEIWSNDKLLKTGELLAAYYKQGTREYYAFRFKDNNTYAYFNEVGDLTKRQFLMSPVANNIINSPYNLDRFHPIHKKVMPHLGTDYKANLGEPVFSVGDGVVVRKGTTEGNGNFIKIKHDDTYQSQYLHFSDWPKSMNVGKRVKQGEVIGYAGETGYASGVHVCFRFWVNDKQKDHTKEELFQKTKPFGKLKDLQTFASLRDNMMEIMEQMSYD